MNGVFSIKYSSEGEYYLNVSFVGYQTVQTEVFKLSSENPNIVIDDIILKNESLSLAGVDVIGRKRQVVYRLDKREIDASGIISASGGTAVDILQQTPSFTVDAEGELSFRGSKGFKVYINGRPASIDGNSALEQIPAEHIDNIEVISNPSARYEADGMAGIININTKKTTGDGWSGILNAVGSSDESRNLDFLASFGKDNFVWRVSGIASRNYVKSDFDQMKKITMSDTLTTTHATGERIRYVDIFSLKNEFDWGSDKTTWTAALEGRYRKRNRGGTLHYDDTYLSKITNQTTNVSFNGSDFVRLTDWTFRADAGFNHRFDGDAHKLSGAFYVMYEADALEYFQTDLFDMQGNREQGHKAWEDEYRLTAQANLDYVRPFGADGGKIETGYYFFTYTEDGDYTIDIFNPSSSIFERRNDLYNKFLFRRDIHALYGLLSDNISDFSYQLGLRGEYTYRKLGNNEKWAEHSQHKFGLFPSAHLSYSINDNRLFFAYSRRITQPELFYMEPYVVYVDHYTAQRGSPLIKPEYTNSLELGYSKNIGDNSSLTGTLFHRIRKDKIERLRVPYHTGITLDSMTNVGNDYATGAELATSLRVKPWWNMDINGSLYYYRIKNDYKTDGKDDKSWNWQLAFNNNFDIAKNTRVRLESYYVGPTISTQGRVKEFFYINLSARQQYFNRRLTASLTVRDLLATAKYESTQEVFNMHSHTIIYPRSPHFTLSLSYTFNNFVSRKKEEKNNHDLFEGTNR